MQYPEHAQVQNTVKNAKNAEKQNICFSVYSYNLLLSRQSLAGDLYGPVSTYCLNIVTHVSVGTKKSVAYRGFLAPGARSRFSAHFSEMVDPKLISVIFKSESYELLLTLLTFCVNRPTHSCTPILTSLWPRCAYWLVRFFKYQVNFSAPLTWPPGHVPPCPPLKEVYPRISSSVVFITDLNQENGFLGGFN